MNGSWSRRSWLSSVLTLFTARGLRVPLAASAPAPASAMPQPQAGPPRNLRAVSMAMHIHGSFSEGTASYEAHLQQAREHGVDVIWWTDHDFRIASHDYRRAVRFDGLRELEGPLEWTWKEERQGAVAEGGGAEFVEDPHSPDEPGRAMRLTGRAAAGADTSGDAAAALWYHATAWNWTYSVSMADTTLELDVFAEETGPGRELALEIQASYHPARHDRPAGQYILEYRIGGTDREAHHTAGADSLRGIVDLPAPRGRWQRLRLRPVADMSRIWPDLVAEDNSLHQLRLGVRLQPDADTRVVVDRLRFDRGRGAGESGLALRREVLARYREEYPTVTHHEAFEVSMGRHLNWFGGTLALPPFPSPPYRNNDVDYTKTLIDFVHAHGGLVQWNHPLDVEKPASLVKLMIERQNIGADLVEIGREPVEPLRQVLDAAARNAVFFTATGVSDDHAGRDWIRQGSNRITYVWARSTSVDDLLIALRAGRAWWVNPAKWRGELSMFIDGELAIGAVSVTQAEQVTVRIYAGKLPAGGVLEIVEGPVDYAGPQLTPATRVRPVTPSPAASALLDYIVEPGSGPGGRYLRLQVRDGAGDIVGESNPFWILREPPAHGIPAARRLARQMGDY